MSKELGDAGEAEAAHLLRERGYGVREIGGNYPVIDLEVTASTPFRVSVKTSRTKQHVRLGTENSITQLRDDDFVFAILPNTGSDAIDIAAREYALLILPGAVAREGGLCVHHSYLEEKAGRSASAGVLVKGYSRRTLQVQTWAEWLTYRDRWDLLPAPL